MKDKVLIFIKEYNDDLSKRQPWYTVKCLIRDLENLGKKVYVTNDIQKSHDYSDYTLIRVFSFSDFFQIFSRNENFIYLMTFPLYKFSKLRKLGLRAIYDSYTHIDKILFSALIPNFWIARTLRRASGVITISDCSYDFLESISVKSLKYYPFIFENWGSNDSLAKLKDRSKSNITIGYFGPPYSTRCFEEVLNFFVWVSKQNAELNKKVITRIERSDLNAKVSSQQKKIDEGNIDLVSGFLSRDILLKELIEIDVFILPFKIVMSELPIVVIEAIEMGAKLVTSHESGISDLTKGMRNVLLVNNFSRTSFSDILDFIEHDSNATGIEFKGRILEQNENTMNRLCQS